MPPPPRVGGSFAPPLPPERLARYRELAESATPQVREAMTKLCDMVEAFGRTPRSRAPGAPHPSGAPIAIVPLEQAEIERMDEHVPWQEELDVFAGWFDRIDPARQKELRDAAFHLLWFGRELFLDREPLCSDQLDPAPGR
jgi:hypothetical protein